MKRHVSSLLILICAAMVPAIAPSEDAYRPLPVTGDFGNPGGDLAEKDLAWNRFDNFFENEHTYMAARLDQGYWLAFQIFTFKYGPNQRWGIYAFVSSDSGKQWFGKREIYPRDANVSYEDISWESNGTSVKGAYPKYSFSINEEAFKAQIEVNNLAPGWKLGRWLITEDGKSFGECFIYMPWGKVSGTLTLDGKQTVVTGYAYADRFHGSFRFDRADPMFYSVRALTPLDGSAQVSIEASFNHFNPAFGKISMPNLMIMEPGGFVKATQKVVIKGEDFYKDPNLGYSFPRRLSVAAREGDFVLQGVFRAQRNMEMLDVISQIPPYLRKLVTSFVKLPVLSKWDGILEGSYSLKGRQTNFRIRAIGEINLIGGPQAQIP